MKRKLDRLSKKERERVESQYHRMTHNDFDDTMSKAVRQSPSAVRLPTRLVKKLKTVAERRGEADYQNIVRDWIEQRLQQEINVTPKEAENSANRLPRKQRRMEPTTIKSSMLRLAGYDEKTHELEVVFNTGDRYRYENVPRSKYIGLLNAESVGAYLRKHIINVYPYRRVKRNRKSESLESIAL